MVALMGGDDGAREALDALDDVWIANVNGTGQIVVSGHARGPRRPPRAPQGARLAPRDPAARRRRLPLARSWPRPRPNSTRRSRARRGARPTPWSISNVDGARAHVAPRSGATALAPAHLAGPVPRRDARPARVGHDDDRDAARAGCSPASPSASVTFDAQFAPASPRRAAGDRRCEPPRHRHRREPRHRRGDRRVLHRPGRPGRGPSRSGEAPSGCARSVAVDVADSARRQRRRQGGDRRSSDRSTSRWPTPASPATASRCACPTSSGARCSRPTSTGPSSLARAALASMVRARSGSIIFIGSVGPFMGVPGPGQLRGGQGRAGRAGALAGQGGRLARHHRQRRGARAHRDRHDQRTRRRARRP